MLGLTKLHKGLGLNTGDNFRLFYVTALAIPIGLIAGLVAFLLFRVIGVFWNLFFFQHVSFTLSDLTENPIGVWMIVLPGFGGLVVSLMSKYGTPKIKGHGIPEAMEAILENRSKVSPRVAILKPISTAVAIGTGGPFGAEGPIIQTGGALGSLLGQAVKTTAVERKVLLACGAAAGMAATFNTPIASVILAIELLLFEFKTRSFIPLVMATVVATVVRIPLLGEGPLFLVSIQDFGIPRALPFYLVLGVVCGLAAFIFTRALYFTEDLFEKLPISRFWYPVVGGVGLGLIGFFYPRVLGVGYETISAILNNDLPATILIGLVVFKSLALFLSLGSGTSGGLLAPMFMVGAALGAVFAISSNLLFPAVHLAPNAFALAAMGAIFGAASRSTFAFIIFAFEITQNYHAILPLMLVSVVADSVGVLLMRETIMTEKLARRGLHVPQQYSAEILDRLKVEDVMDPEPQVLPASLPLKELLARMAANKDEYAIHQAFPLLDDDGVLRGILTRGDLLKAVNSNVDFDTKLEQINSRELITVYTSQSLREALRLLITNDVGRLPVVSIKSPGKLVGYLSRSSILKAYKVTHDEETILDRG